MKSDKFDEAAFDAAVRGMNGWSDVADPVTEIRRMRGAAPGNAAAMREALECAIDAIQTMIALYDEEHTAAIQIGATWKRSDTSEVNAIVEQARAALSAPPRNCDRYANGTEAGIAFRAERHEVDEDAFWPSLVNWLFAPAEGGAE